jgi:alkanesulfonate monooxygenase SsuD/methylene tetrahydromethanopterin reductase-like flavin-dependent oxidoreductase (luciferase family)
MDMPYEPRFGILVLPDAPWPAIVERVRRYEALGFDSAWIADHFVSPWNPSGPWFECWSLLGALAAQTNRIRLGPLVSHPVYHNPALLARQALTVDHVSGGRLALGLGAGASGYDPPMTGGAWWPPAERVGRFRELVEIVDRLLRDEVTTYHGRYYRVTEAAMAPGPLQRPRPPLTIAASGPRMLKIAARFADAWNTEGAFAELYQQHARPEDVRRLVRERSEFLNEQAAAIGRDPGTIRRSFLFGFGPAPETPWASADAFEHAVGRYREIGCTEFIFPEPGVEERAVFERVVHELIPRLQRATNVTGHAAS